MNNKLIRVIHIGEDYGKLEVFVRTDSRFGGKWVEYEVQLGLAEALKAIQDGEFDLPEEPVSE